VEGEVGTQSLREIQAKLIKLIQNK